MVVGIISGGFDPLHKGHIAYIKSAKEHCDLLVVGCNSDNWLTRKKGRPFMSWEDRVSIVENLKDVHCVLPFNDDDDSAFDLITRAINIFDAKKFIFMNGGDRTKENIPEEVKSIANGYTNVEFMFEVGGEDKKNSSSWILSNWDKPTTQRNWGTYKILDSNGTWRVKELSFTVGKSLSDQKHFDRSEHWHVVKGAIRMDLQFEDNRKESVILHEGDSIDIPIQTWHKATNIGSVDAKVIEVWLGSHLSEEDILRRD